MSGELNNRHSIDINEMEKQNFTSLFEMDKYLLIPGKIRIQNHINILVSYFNDRNEYNKYLQIAIDSLHDSIPENDKQECTFKTGDDISKHDDRCLEYLTNADLMFEVLSYLFVIGIINNEDKLHTKELKREMAIAFFDNLIFNKGVLDCDDDRLKGIIINKLLDLKKEIYAEIESTEDIIINAYENLKYLKDYQIKAKNLKDGQKVT